MAATVAWGHDCARYVGPRLCSVNLDTTLVRFSYTNVWLWRVAARVATFVRGVRSRGVAALEPVCITVQSYGSSGDGRLLAVEREAVFVVVQALGEASRMMQDAGVSSSTWHRRFTDARFGLLEALAGYEVRISQSDAGACVDRRPALRAVPSLPLPSGPTERAARSESA